jgi:hypothetical protein
MNDGVFMERRGRGGKVSTTIIVQCQSMNID